MDERELEGELERALDELSRNRISPLEALRFQLTVDEDWLLWTDAELRSVHDEQKRAWFASDRARGRPPDPRAVAIDVEQQLGDVRSAIASDALLARAHEVSGDLEAALRVRLNALSWCPRWHSTETSRLLTRIADTLVRLDQERHAVTFAEEALRYDPSAPATLSLASSVGVSPSEDLASLAPLSQDEMALFFAYIDYDPLPRDHFSLPRSIMLTCARLGDVGYAILPYLATKKYRPYVGNRLGYLGLVDADEAAWNKQLFERLTGHPDGAAALKRSRSRDRAEFYPGTFLPAMKLCEAAASERDTDGLRRYLHFWHRGPRLSAARHLLEQEQDSVARLYIEQSLAIEAFAGGEGSPCSRSWAMPAKIRKSLPALFSS